MENGITLQKFIPYIQILYSIQILKSHLGDILKHLSREAPFSPSSQILLFCFIGFSRHLQNSSEMNGWLNMIS